MEVIAPRRPVGSASVVPLMSNTALGMLLVAGGLAMGYVAYATPLLSAALPSGRLDAGQMAIGMAAWGVALVGPAALVLAGAVRLARILAVARGRRPARSIALRGLNDLPDDVTVASGLTLPDGRGVSHLVLGPFGTAVVRELPPAKVTRVRDGHWELRTARGWTTLNDPLERATRDAERVRRWMANDDADFVVKVYAAVIGPDPQVARTPTCAVLTPDQLAAWVTALPPQRSLTESRLQRMLDTARHAAV